MNLRDLPRASVTLVLCSAIATGGCAGAQAGFGADDGSQRIARHALVGNDAPPFVLQSINRKGVFSVKENVGKVIVIDFWATWCEPCKKSFPKLQGLYARYKSRGFVVIGVSQDDDSSSLAEFAHTYGADFPVGWDKDKEIVQKYDPKNMPTSFVIDRRGIVRFVHLGYRDGDEAELETQIKSLL
jgi:cytochrome c biogenesis protein CcmG/thiol:disulfide interchange protein DsbE